MADDRQRPPRVKHCPCCGSTDISPVPGATRGGGKPDEVDIRCYGCSAETVVRELGSREDDMKPFEATPADEASSTDG